MEQYSNKIKHYLRINCVEAEHLTVTESCHTVAEAAKAVNGSAKEFVKNICMLDENNRLIVAIVRGEDRASTSRVAKALNIERPRLANEKEVLAGTGYPPGGVPSFGFVARFLIDPKVLDLENVYTGGGTPNSLIKISIEELLAANKGQVVRVRK